MFQIRDDGQGKDVPVKFLEAVPAIRRIDTNRDALFAIDIVGDVSAADAENLFGLLEAAYAMHPRIDVLVRLTDHGSVDWANISEDTLRQGADHALPDPLWRPKAAASTASASASAIRTSMPGWRPSPRRRTR